MEDLARGGPEVALRDGSMVMSSHEDYTYHLDPASGELLRAAGAAGGELRQLDTNQRAPSVQGPGPSPHALNHCMNSMRGRRDRRRAQAARHLRPMSQTHRPYQRALLIIFEACVF